MPSSLTAEWARLEAALGEWWLAHPDGRATNWLRVSLTGLLRWCASQRKIPGHVTDETIRQYVAHRKRTDPALRKTNEANTRQAWNKAACVVPGWPPVWVSPYAKPVARRMWVNGQMVRLAYDEFTPALIAEVQRYCENRGFLDPVREALLAMSHSQRMQSRLANPNFAAAIVYSHKRPAPLTDTTLRFHRQIIFRSATALHVSGDLDAASITKIGQVVTPQAAAILADTIAQGRWRAPGTDTYAHNAVHGLAHIAARCGMVCTPIEQNAWRELKMDIYAPAANGRGLSKRNLKRLQQFDDPRTFGRLLALPDIMMAEMEEGRRRRGAPVLHDARVARMAVAIDLLNTLPIRRRSLITLDLPNNFTELPEGGAKLIVYFDQEKSKKTLGATLSARTWRLISIYSQHYRPLLRGADRSTLLFPGPTRDGHVSPNAFAASISDYVRRRLGAEINIHLWRHVMASKLTEKTERLEDAQQLLGHVTGSSNTTDYVRLGTHLASTKLRDLTDEARRQGLRSLKPRHRGVRVKRG